MTHIHTGQYCYSSKHLAFTSGEIKSEFLCNQTVQQHYVMQQATLEGWACCNVQQTPKSALAWQHSEASPGSENQGAGCFFCQNLSTIWSPHSKKKKVIYYVIAGDVLGAKASTPKHASVISKKSQTISVIWFKGLARTAQKAALHPERGGGGQKKHAGGMRHKDIRNQLCQFVLKRF